jgi:hypothetical protein
MASLPVVALHPAPRTCAVVPVLLTHPRYDDLRTVIAGYHDQRVLCHAEAHEGLLQFTDDKVELVDEVAKRACL